MPIAQQTFHAFTAGTKIQRYDLRGEILYATEHECLLKYDGESNCDLVSIKELEAEYGQVFHFTQNVTPMKALPRTLSRKKEREIIRRKRYITEVTSLLKGNASVGGKSVREMAIKNVQAKTRDLTPPSPATLARWLKMEKETVYGSASNLMFNLRKPYKSQFEYLKPLALEVIDEFYLQTNQQTMQCTFDIFVDRVKEQYGADADHPSFPVFIKWIKDICSLETIKKREGKRATKEVMRNAVSKLITKTPLERVEIDGVRLAIGLVDDEGNYIGMPTLIIAIDCYTRCVLGYCLHTQKGEPASSYIHTYRHAICPKPIGSFSEDCESDWPFYGVWDSAVVDGGSGSMSTESSNFLLSMGSQFKVTEVAAGWKKPFIERFNGTLRTNFCQNIRSYCGHNMTKIRDATVRQKAHLTPDAFRKLLEKWIVDEYHHSKHSGIDYCTPYDMWKKALSEGFIPLLPAQIEAMKLPQGERKSRIITGNHCHKGVEINGIHYNDKERRLKQIGLTLRQKGETPVVECCYAITDISSITVIDPITDAHFVVSANEDIQPGTSLSEYQAKNPSKKYQKGYGRKRISAQSDALKKANAEHDVKMRQNKPGRKRKADINEMTKGVIEKKQELNEASNTKAKAKTKSKDSAFNIDFSQLKGHDCE